MYKIKTRNVQENDLGILSSVHLFLILYIMFYLQKPAFYFLLLCSKKVH